MPIYLRPGETSPSSIRLRDPTVGDSGSPQTGTPGSAIRSWVIPAVAVILGAVTASPSAAHRQWTNPAPSVSVGAVTRTPAPGTRQWVNPTPSVSVGAVVATPAHASRAWTVPAPSVVLGNVALTPAPAVRTWSARASSVSLGGVIALPAPATRTWVALAPSVTVPSLPQTATPAVAITTWVVPTPFAGEVVAQLPTGPGFLWRPDHRRPTRGEPQYAYPAPAGSGWLVRSVHIELGDVERTLAPAITDWVVMAPQIETAPDPDEEMLILLLTEKG